MNTFNILKVCVVCAIGISAASCNNSFMDRYPIAEISPEIPSSLHKTLNCTQMVSMRTCLNQ